MASGMCISSATPTRWCPLLPLVQSHRATAPRWETRRPHVRAWGTRQPFGGCNPLRTGRISNG